MKDRLFVSLFMYAYAKIEGERWAKTCAAELIRSEIKGGDPSHWAGFRTLKEVRRVADCVVLVEASSLIAKARSRAAGYFLQSDCDVWVTCDDDVYADHSVVRQLVAAARETRGVVSAPCQLRDPLKSREKSGLGLNFCAIDGAKPEGGLLPVLRTGFGLVALHRSAVEKAARVSPWVKEGAMRYPAMFIEGVIKDEWVGEDYALSIRCKATDVPIFALAGVVTEHAGMRATLEVPR